MPNVEARCQKKNGLTLTKADAFLQCHPGVTGKMQGVGLDREPGLRLDLLEEMGGKQHIEIQNFPGFGAGQMAVVISSVAIETAIGALKAFDHSGRLQSFQILINGGVANVAPLIVELLEDVPSGKMAFFGPQQIQNHAPLTTQPHAQMAATLVDLLNLARGWRHQGTIIALATGLAARGGRGGRGGMQPPLPRTIGLL